MLLERHVGLTCQIAPDLGEGISNASILPAKSSVSLPGHLPPRVVRQLFMVKKAADSDRRLRRVRVEG